MDNFGNIFFDKFEIVIKKWNIYLFLLEKKNDFVFIWNDFDVNCWMCFV